MQYRYNLAKPSIARSSQNEFGLKTFSEFGTPVDQLGEEVKKSLAILARICAVFYNIKGKMHFSNSESHYQWMYVMMFGAGKSTYQGDVQYR